MTDAAFLYLFVGLFIGGILGFFVLLLLVWAVGHAPDDDEFIDNDDNNHFLR